MAAVARNRFSAEYGDAVDTAHAHYRRKCTLFKKEVYGVLANAYYTVAKR